jgi:hypothetical protein
MCEAADGLFKQSNRAEAVKPKTAKAEISLGSATNIVHDGTVANAVKR